MPVKHLLDQLEQYKSKRNNRDLRPAWVTRFVNEAAELFEPLDEIGRVGFDCQFADDCWEVALYLGSQELVGGREDGQRRHSSFHFDVNGLLNHFDQVEQLQFAAYHQMQGDEIKLPCGLVMIDGWLETNRLKVRVHSIPPAEMGPGLRRYADGRCATV